ncbi:uncharacterized protein LOC134375589 [Cynocephalus volans]|uniref:uncharacterized protein LOC134375589 n=1 Tax=Cynocephalus volans TaxID=110931 RepID=UPI002FCC7676
MAARLGGHRVLHVVLDELALCLPGGRFPGVDHLEEHGRGGCCDVALLSDLTVHQLPPYLVLLHQGGSGLHVGEDVRAIPEHKHLCQVLGLVGLVVLQVVAEGQQMLPEGGLEVRDLGGLHRVEAVADLHPGSDCLVLQVVHLDVLAVGRELTIEVGEEGELGIDGGCPGVRVAEPVINELRTGLYEALLQWHHVHVVRDEVLAILRGEALRVVAPQHQPQLHIAQVVPAAPRQRCQHRYVQCLLAALEAWSSRFPHPALTGQEQDQQGRKAQGHGWRRASPWEPAAPQFLHSSGSLRGSPWPAS